MKKWTDKTERGIALIVALFALLLLSAVGLGMMYATNAETYINANFRDKQIAQYASVAGVQEARDRIQPVNTIAPITAPTAVPSTSAANIIYIINPSSGETVAPWDTSNAYFDSELCQENVLGLSGTAGVPCTTIASGSTWYSTVDDSASSNAPWNLTTPTANKWTRIAVKTNNMTPVPVDGVSTNSTQICWDGKQQIPLPAGYVANCGPSHKVVSVVLTSPGTGYTSAPTVSITGGGGSGAAATVNFTDVPSDSVGAVTLTNVGAGYTSAPTVTISNPNSGTDVATAVASISDPGAPLSSLTLTDAGTQCFAAGTTPSVQITANTGSGGGAAGTATLATSVSCIYSLTVSANCKKSETVSFTVTAGASNVTVGTVGTNSSNGDLNAVTPTMTNPGSYSGGAVTVTAKNTLSNTQCTNVTATATPGYRIATISLTSPGAAYKPQAGNSAVCDCTIVIGGGTGTASPTTAAKAMLGTAPPGANTVTSVTLTHGGSGYTTAPSVTFSGGGAPTTTAVATASLGSVKQITGVTITASGSGYFSIPTVTISGGGGSGATAYATVDGVSGLTYGMVYTLTSLAQTPSGARAMTQSEVVTPVRGLALTGALTLDGPNPVVDQLPNSSLFFVNGTDAHSCGEPAVAARPALGAYDDPNASPPTTSVDTVTAAVPSGRTSNYVGSANGPSPDVENVFGSLGDTLSSPTGLLALSQAVAAAPGANVYSSNPGSINYGTSTNPAIDYVDGDLTLNGNNTGYGILLVTGTLNMGGNFSWNGLILVIGDGILDFSGGGGGQINGSVIEAKIWDSYTTKNLLPAVGSPTLSWAGGGGNGIHYDHCWADNSLSRIPFIPPPPTKQLTVISTRTLTY